MCQQCLDAAKKHFPGHTDSEYNELLWSATAFPFAPPDHIERQLIEAVTLFGNDIGKAIGYAATHMDFASHGIDLDVRVNDANSTKGAEVAETQNGAGVVGPGVRDRLQAP